MMIYKYLYYRLYSWNKRTWGEEDLPHWKALFGVSFMMFINLGLIALLLQSLGVNIFLRDDKPVFLLILVMLSLFIINYFKFIKNKRYEQIVKNLKKESKKQRLKNSFLIWFYVVFSFGCYILWAIWLGF